MRRYPAHIRNFYDDDDDNKDETGPVPLPKISIAPTARHSAVTTSTAPLPQPPTHRRRSESDSTASIEDVIIHGTSRSTLHSHCEDGDASDSGEYISLRALRATVAAAERDVRRLRALMVKAVWLALTQSTGKKRSTTKSSRSGNGVGATARGSDGRTHGSMALGTTVASALSCYFNEKPFLPPDRYPAIPPVKESWQHVHVNLSHALAAASRAGLLERQRVWSQRRHGSLPSSLPVSPQVGKAAGLPRTASTRQTALQRISSLSTTTNALTPAATAAGAAHTKRVVEDKEACVQASLSLLILRVAKDRAVATLFLRQLRLDAYERHLLHEEVEMRYAYYIQRRVLQSWRRNAKRHVVWRQQLLRHVVAHWQHFVDQRQFLRERLRCWRRQLRHRAAAFLALQRAQRTRCWQRWRHALMWHRERSGLYEAAVRFSDIRHPTSIRGQGGRSELLALIHGAPLVSAGGAVVATPVGHRLALHHLFHAWKTQTERRLMVHLALRHRVQCVRRRVVRVLCGRARAMALRRHRQQREVVGREASASAAAAAAAVVADTSAVGTTNGAPPPPPVRATMRVHTFIVVPPEVYKYKVSAALRIMHAARLRNCLSRWRIRFRVRCADRFHAQSVHVHVLRRWLHAVTLRHQNRPWKALVLQRWVLAAQHRRDAAVALRSQVFRLLRSAFCVWQRHCHLRAACTALQQRSCMKRWRERAALRAGSRVLRRRRQRQLLLRWHARAIVRVDTGANLYVAATLFETGLLLGCVRRWRSRAAEHHRILLAWGIFVQLRDERLCRRCFAVWQHRAFGPAVVQSSRRRDGTAESSPAMSLLA